MKRTFITFALAASLSTIGFAHADFTHTVQYAYAAKTSLKIAEPAHFHVSVLVDGQKKEDTIPTIISLPDADAYVPVTITAPDGKSWSGKIEVKAHQQATLSFRYTAGAAPAPGPAPAARKYIGRVVNLTNTCDATHQGDKHFEFLDSHGTKVYEADVTMNTYKPNVELPQGEYDVRVFKITKGGPVYESTAKTSIAADGWKFEWSCSKR